MNALPLFQQPQSKGQKPAVSWAVSKTALLLSLLCMSGAAAAESSLPRLTIDQLEYQGGFRIPNATYGTSTSSYSYGAIGLNPEKKTLYVAGHEYHGAIAEFNMPAIVNSTKLADLKIASAPVQGFSNVLSKSNIDWGNGLRINGIFQSGGKLMVNMYRFYDQSPFLQTPTMILENAANIQTSTTKGYVNVQGGSKAVGWVSPIPAEFQSVLGGTHMTGFSSSTARAIIHNGSVGPSAYAFNPVAAMTNSGSISSISTVELMSFSLGQPGLITEDSELYNTNLTNKYWTHASEASFGMIVPGTRTYLVLGGSGGHNSGMSYGTAPYGGYKGHYTIDQYDNYPYYWLFDVNDFEKVRKGQMKPYSVRPYAVGKFNAPFQTDIVNRVSGGTFDESTGTMYLSIYQSDNLQGGGNPPVIVAYKFKVPGSSQVSPPQAPAGIKADVIN